MRKRKGRRSCAGSGRQQQRSSQRSRLRQRPRGRSWQRYGRKQRGVNGSALSTSARTWTLLPGASLAPQTHLRLLRSSSSEPLGWGTCRAQLQEKESRNLQQFAWCRLAAEERLVAGMQASDDRVEKVLREQLTACRAELAAAKVSSPPFPCQQPPSPASFQIPLSTPCQQLVRGTDELSRLHH